MLKTVQTRLKRIRYYSASRRHTPFSRAMDAAIVISLILAVPATWLSTLLFERNHLALELPGRVWRTEYESLEAALVDPEEAQGSWRQSRPYATFTVRVYQAHRGLPLTNSIVTRPPQIALDQFTQTRSQLLHRLDDTVPPQKAIGQALSVAEHADLLDAMESQRTTRDMQWAMSGVNVVFWWFGLYMLMVAGVMMVRMCSALIRVRGAARMAQRRDRGVCVRCGYDLRGLEFHSRCPECGELV